MISSWWLRIGYVNSCHLSFPYSGTHFFPATNVHDLDGEALGSFLTPTRKWTVSCLINTGAPVGISTTQLR